MYFQILWSDLGWPPSGPASGLYTYDLRVRVGPPTSIGCVNPDRCMDSGQTQTVDVTERVQVPAPGCAPLPYCIPTNTFVYGHVYDKATGSPISNAQVLLESNIFIRGATDQTGLYNLSIVAYRRVDLGTWESYGVKVRVPNSQYADFNGAIIPRTGVPLKLDAYLTKVTQTASYSVYAKYKADGNLNFYSGASSKDGKYFALVEFHDPPPPGAQNWGKNASVYYFAFNGTLLWKYPVYVETPTVDVSDDGKYVVTPAAGPNDTSSPYISLLDNKGNLLWKFSQNGHNFTMNLSNYPPYYRGVRISHDDKQLAAGDTNGFVQLADMSSKKIVWDKYVGGQVRYLEFSQDNSIVYVGADPYFYAFSTNGTTLWRTNVNAWPNAIASSRHYFAISAKVSNALFLLDRNTGRIVWKYPVETSPVNLAIAPDESYLLAQTQGGSIGTGVFDANGTLEFDLAAQPSAQGQSGGQPDKTTTGAISSDGKYMLVGGWLPPSIALLNRAGDVLWSMVPDNSRFNCADGYSQISPDTTSMVVAVCNWVYFLHGNITSVSSSSNTTTTSTTSTASSTSTTTSSTTTSTSSSSAASKASSTTSTTSASSGGGSGIPEFPYQILAATVFTVVVVASYLVVRRHPLRGVRAGSRNLRLPSL